MCFYLYEIYSLIYLFYKIWFVFKYMVISMDRTLESMPLRSPLLRWWRCSSWLALTNRMWWEWYWAVPWLAFKRTASSSCSVYFWEPWADIKANPYPVEEMALRLCGERERPSELGIADEPPDDSNPSCHLTSAARKISKEISRRITQLNPAVRRRDSKMP